MTLVEKELIERIISCEMMSREYQVGEFNQYQERQFDYQKGEDVFSEKLPDNLYIFMSCYTYENYQGRGWLVGYDTEQQMFFTNAGSHCSCYGLEGQWDIEYYSFEQLIEVTQRIVDSDDGESRYDDEDRLHAGSQVELLKLLRGDS